MKNRNVIVGLFVVAGVTLFTIAIFLIGSSHRAFTHHFEVYADFANVSGLTNGAKVQVGGLDAGEVKEISVPSSPMSKFRLRISLEQSVHGLVRNDSVVSIATQGVVGDKLLMIQPGTAQAPQAAPGTTLPSKEPLDLSELLNKSAGLLNDASGTMKTVAGKLNGTLDAVTTTVNNANVTSALAPDSAGVDAGTNIRQSLSSLAVATGNMAEDTEALKHEFFFRGFFKHRGYCSLSHLDPAKYRTDKTFTSNSSQRIWFEANELFQVMPNGLEALSQSGKERLDQAVANIGDAVLAVPIVIEGYSTDGTPGNQLAFFPKQIHSGTPISA